MKTMKCRDYLEKRLTAEVGSFLGQRSFNCIAFAAAEGFYWPNKGPPATSAIAAFPWQHVCSGRPGSIL